MSAHEILMVPVYPDTPCGYPRRGAQRASGGTILSKDLLIGLTLSLSLHIAVLYGDRLFPAAKSPRLARPQEAVIQMKMWKVEADEPDKVTELDQAPPVQALAPPRLPEAPTLVPVTAYAQAITPPPPELQIDKTALAVAIVKPEARFGRGIKNLFNSADLDQPAQPRGRLAPIPPLNLERQGIGGDCLVEFIVAANGDVIDARVIRSSHPGFEAPSITAVRTCKFRPGKKAGRAVASRCQQYFKFNLDAK